MRLIIGNKNYSSWSMRPWLLMRAFNLQFEEKQLSLSKDNLPLRLAEFSPSSRVPVLEDGGITVWDSLAICEYLSERYLQNKAWPSDVELRAKARAICAEMHAGFANIRSELPMNCRAQRKVNVSEEAQQEIERIDYIWSQHLGNSGLWLCGDFSIADCFFAPVALRFRTYGIPLSRAANAYMQNILNMPSVVRWFNEAEMESEILPEDERGVPA